MTEAEIRADERAQLAARATDQEREMVEALRPPCPKRRLHEQWKHSVNTELRMAAQMCTPDQPCRDCIEWEATKSTLLAALTAARERGIGEWVAGLTDEQLWELGSEEWYPYDRKPNGGGMRAGVATPEVMRRRLRALAAPAVADTTAPEVAAGAAPQRAEGEG